MSGVFLITTNSSWGLNGGKRFYPLVVVFLRFFWVFFGFLFGFLVILKKSLKCRTCKNSETKVDWVSHIPLCSYNCIQSHPKAALYAGILLKTRRLKNKIRTSHISCMSYWNPFLLLLICESRWTKCLHSNNIDV